MLRTLSALSPKELPEETEPVQEEGRVAFVRKVRARKIIRDFNLLAVLAIGHHGVAINAVHSATRAGLGAIVGVDFDRFVLDEGAGAFVVTTFQKVVIDISVEVGDHELGGVHVHIAVVTRSRGAVVHHWDTADRASNPRVHSSNVHRVHGGEWWNCSHLCPDSAGRFKSRISMGSKRASTDSGDQA